MPKVKEGVRYNKNYTEEKLQNALNAINSGMAIRVAAKQFNVPRATLQFRKSAKFSKSSLGPKPILNMDEEQLIVKWITECQRKGFPRRLNDVQTSVKNFLDKSPRENPFVNNYPGEGWYKAFLRRHPEVSIRTPEGVSAASSKVSEKDIRKWFENIYEYLTTKGYANILTDPTRIFNGDETGFMLCPKNSKVLAPRGCKNVYEIEQGPSKATITVMFTFGADGTLTTPMIIYPYKRLPAEIAASVPEGWGIGLSDSGWMKAEVMYEYIANVLYPCLIEKNVKFPIILFLDGHSTHLTYQLSELCTRLDIILISLYPNATRILQPADVAAFKPIKTGWKEGVLDWRRQNMTDSLTKDKFAPVLKNVIDKYTKKETIQHGFRACGLYPFDANAVDYTKCLGGNNTKTRDHQLKDIHDDDNILTYKTFKQIVGDQKIAKFLEITRQTADDLEPELPNEDVVLYQLWKEFEKNHGFQTAVEIKGNNQLENDVFTNTIIDNNEGIGTVPDLSPTDNIKRTDEMDSIALEHESDKNAEDQVENAYIEILNNQDNFDFENMPIWICNENNEIDNVCNASANTLENVLQWPVTPVRKGTRQTERLPFVLTCTQWKQIKKEKDDTKKQKEREKEERKEKRLENKKNKEQKPTKKKCNKIPVRNAPKTKIQEATKMLFNTEEKNIEKINILSDVRINNINNKLSDENENTSFCHKMDEAGLKIGKNCKILSGLCYNCAKNINNQAGIGLKCSTCIRQFHVTCIIKSNLHKSNSDIFECISCLKKKN